jgi:ankyrin repeat protein
MFAAERGKTSSAKILLAHGANVNQKGARSTPLIAAASGSHAEMVAFLLSQGAEVNARDPEGYTALFYAANNSQNEDANDTTLPVVTILLNQGAKVDACGNDGSTPLMWAAGKGETRVCETLLNSGADVNAVDNSGKSPLLHAVDGAADPVLARLLVSHGADVNAQDAAGETALMKAARRKQP